MTFAVCTNGISKCPSPPGQRCQLQRGPLGRLFLARMQHLMHYVRQRAPRRSEGSEVPATTVHPRRLEGSIPRSLRSLTSSGPRGPVRSLGKGGTSYGPGGLWTAMAPSMRRGLRNARRAMVGQPLKWVTGTQWALHPHSSLSRSPHFCLFPTPLPLNSQCPHAACTARDPQLRHMAWAIVLSPSAPSKQRIPPYSGAVWVDGE